jgi:hypothetical protein
MDALQDPAVDISLKHAIKSAQYKIASGYLMAAHEPGLPPHERAAYIAMHREARDLAAEDGTTPLCIIQHNGLGCAEPGVSIGSYEHMFVSGELNEELSSEESEALGAASRTMLDLAADLPPTSRVRAFLLRQCAHYASASPPVSQGTPPLLAPHL